MGIRPGIWGRGWSGPDPPLVRWRVSAASEIAALVAAAIGFLGLRAFTEVPFPDSLLYLVPWTTVCWLTVTWLMPPEPMAHLVAFYRRVTPGGPGWRPVAAAANAPPPDSLRGPFVDWIAGCLVVYGILFGAGGALFGSAAEAVVPLGLATTAGLWLWRSQRGQFLSRMTRRSAPLRWRRSPGTGAGSTGAPEPTLSPGHTPTEREAVPIRRLPSRSAA